MSACAGKLECNASRHADGQGACARCPRSMRLLLHPQRAFSQSFLVTDISELLTRGSRSRQKPATAPPPPTTTASSRPLASPDLPFVRRTPSPQTRRSRTLRPRSLSDLPCAGSSPGHSNRFVHPRRTGDTPGRRGAHRLHSWGRYQARARGNHARTAGAFPAVSRVEKDRWRAAGLRVDQRPLARGPGPFRLSRLRVLLRLAE